MDARINDLNLKLHRNIIFQVLFQQCKYTFDLLVQAKFRYKIPL